MGHSLNSPSIFQRIIGLEKIQTSRFKPTGRRANVCTTFACWRPRRGAEHKWRRPLAAALRIGTQNSSVLTESFRFATGGGRKRNSAPVPRRRNAKNPDTLNVSGRAARCQPYAGASCAQGNSLLQRPTFNATVPMSARWRATLPRAVVIVPLSRLPPPRTRPSESRNPVTCKSESNRAAVPLSRMSATRRARRL